MRVRKLSLILNLLVFPVALLAQTDFAPIGAVWFHAQLHNLENHDSTIRYRVSTAVGDTVIDNILCRKIEQRSIGRQDWSTPGAPLDTNRLPDGYAYTSGDTVFYYSNDLGRFTPLYIFNVQAGDTVVYEVAPQAFDTSSSFRILVDSITIVNLGGVALRRVHFHPLAPSNYWVNATHYTERMGAFGSYLLEHFFGIYPAIYVLPYLRCYQDADFSVVMTHETCNYLPTEVHMVESPTHFRIFPNPSKGLIHMTHNVEGALMVKVQDYTGRLVHTALLPGGSKKIGLDLAHLSAGNYLIVVYDEKRRKLFQERLVLQP